MFSHSKCPPPEPRHDWTHVITDCGTLSKSKVRGSWEWVDRHKICVVQVPKYFQLELNKLGYLKCPTQNNLQRCFSNWVPQRGVRGSERRACVWGEEFYWRSSIFMYELKFVWRHSTLIIPSLTTHRQSIAVLNQKLPRTVVK